MHDGWVSLHRKILDNPIWKEKPFSKGQAWVDLILMANHEPKRFMLGNKQVIIERGQLHTSEAHLAERWGWSRKKVRAFLGTAVGNEMAITKATTQGTTITVLNYVFYQDNGTTKGTTKEQQKNREGYINNKYNNISNILPKINIYSEEKKSDKKSKKHAPNEDKNGNPKPSYGYFNNVFLSDEELAKLKADFKDWEDRIERLSDYIQQYPSKGEKYSNHLATIRNWARRDKQEQLKQVEKIEW